MRVPCLSGALAWLVLVVDALEATASPPPARARVMAGGGRWVSVSLGPDRSDPGILLRFRFGPWAPKRQSFSFAVRRMGEAPRSREIGAVVGALGRSCDSFVRDERVVALGALKPWHLEMARAEKFCSFVPLSREGNRAFRRFPSLE